MQNAPVPQQQQFWNQWNASAREQQIDDISVRQREVILGWLDTLGRRDLKIIDVGCGAGWMCEALLPYGDVTGTDLANEVLARAQERMPQAHFTAGDFMALEFPEGTFDIVVTLEVLSHVPDHAAFVAKLARLLKPGGVLMMASQNKPILLLNDVAPTGPGQLRKWFDRAELADLLAPKFAVQEMFTVTPIVKHDLRRLLTAHRVRAAMRKLTGRAYERTLERWGWGWTIMVRAIKR